MFEDKMTLAMELASKFSQEVLHESSDRLKLPGKLTMLDALDTEKIQDEVFALRLSAYLIAIHECDAPKVIKLHLEDCFDELIFVKMSYDPKNPIDSSYVRFMHASQCCVRAKKNPHYWLQHIGLDFSNSCLQREDKKLAAAAHAYFMTHYQDVRARLSVLETRIPSMPHMWI